MRYSWCPAPPLSPLTCPGWGCPGCGAKAESSENIPTAIAGPRPAWPWPPPCGRDCLQVRDVKRLEWLVWRHRTATGGPLGWDLPALQSSSPAGPSAASSSGTFLHSERGIFPRLWEPNCMFCLLLLIHFFLYISTKSNTQPQFIYLLWWVRRRKFSTETGELLKEIYLMKQVLTHYVDKVADKVKIRNQRTLNPSDLVPLFYLERSHSCHGRIHDFLSSITRQ